jgi:asparagine synthase (glutamine-hydrolysing)
MCGVAGFVGISGEAEAHARRLLAAARHRGPDDEGVERLAPAVWFVHTRLAILDVSAAGHQPMRDAPPDGLPPNWTTYNGEIFNFHELNAELAARGWPARTKSDTETLLHAYRVWGESCVEKFRGMFAFALYDATRQTIFLARDRLGVKPLYYSRPPLGGFVFASEVRALLALGPELIPRRVRPSALESFLAQGAVQGYETFFENIELLPPGTALTLDAATGRELKRRVYWQLPLEVTPPRNRAEAVEQLRETAREAVRLRLLSDVPVGLFLSGGVDSAALLAWATENNDAPVQTISLGFDVAAFDESREAEATARALGSRHSAQRLSGADLLNAWPRALAAIDQPTVDGLNTYIVSQAARHAGLTVALSGLGGDELFGGYASFTDVPRALKARNSFVWRNLARLAARAKGGRGGLKIAETLRRETDELGLYLLRRELFLPDERRALRERPAASETASGLPLELLADIRRRGAKLDLTNRVSFWEIELYMRNMLLRDADAFSLAAPIEYRVPFLDHKLVERAFGLPGAWKRPDPRPKPLLVDAAGPRLPREVWQRKKRGFAFPWADWFAPAGALRAMAREAVEDASAWRDLGLNNKGVTALWQRFVAGDKSVSPLQILAFVVLRDYANRHQAAG